MGDVVNLNKYRKARRGRDEKRAAALNRSKYGRNKADLLELKAERERSQHEIDGKRIERDGAGEDQATD